MPFLPPNQQCQSTEGTFRTTFLTRNHSDSVPTTLTLASCFLYSLASKSLKCRGCPISIIVTQSLSWKIESNAFLKSTKHMVVGARVPCASVFWDSWFDLLSSFLVRIPPVHLQFLFRSSLGSFLVWSKKDLACMGDKSNCSVICTLFKITFLGKCDERGERPFLWPLTSFPDRHTYSVHSVSPPALNSSAGTSSGPVVLRLVVWRMAQATSERSGGGSCSQYSCSIPVPSSSQ